MLSCLPWLTSGSTANWTPGSGSTDSAGSTGSFSDDSVTIIHECGARIKKWTYKASINHQLNWACREHYKELMKIGFAEKAFS